MKIRKTQRGDLIRRGYPYEVEWDDKSISYYRTQKEAKGAVGQESGQRGLGIKKDKVHSILAKFKDEDKLFESLGKRGYH